MSVCHTEGDQACVGRQFHEFSDSTQMTRTSQRQNTGPVTFGFLNAPSDGFAADNLTKSKIAVHDEDTGLLAFDLAMSIRNDPASTNPVDVFDDSNHTVRIMSFEICQYQRFCDLLSFVRRNMASLKNLRSELG